jgi:hypothetical protein
MYHAVAVMAASGFGWGLGLNLFSLNLFSLTTKIWVLEWTPKKKHVFRYIKAAHHCRAA